MWGNDFQICYSGKAFNFTPLPPQLAHSTSILPSYRILECMLLFFLMFFPIFPQQLPKKCFWEFKMEVVGEMWRAEGRSWTEHHALPLVIFFSDFTAPRHSKTFKLSTSLSACPSFTMHVGQAYGAHLGWKAPNIKNHTVTATRSTTCNKFSQWHPLTSTDTLRDSILSQAVSSCGMSHIALDWNFVHQSLTKSSTAFRCNSCLKGGSLSSSMYIRSKIKGFTKGRPTKPSSCPWKKIGVQVTFNSKNRKIGSSDKCLLHPAPLGTVPENDFTNLVAAISSER